MHLLDGVDATIHPADEMFLNARRELGNAARARATYFRQGHEIASSAQALAGWLAARRGRQPKVLEFACGYGRATRFLVRAVGARRLWVADIYGEAVDFQRGAFGVRGFTSAHEPAQVDCGERFDLIFVASLFTHLPATRFGAWIARLFGWLAPGGVLAFSTHDMAHIAEQLPRHGLRAGDIFFAPRSESARLDKAEYGAAYVTEAFVAKAIRAATAGGWPYRRLPRALCGFQDLYLVGRDPAEDFRTFEHGGPPLGCVDAFALEADGTLRVAGWAGEPNPAERIESVGISIGGIEVASVTPQAARPDVAKAVAGHLLHSGWEMRVAGIDRRAQGDLPLAVVARSSTARHALLHTGTLAETRQLSGSAAAPSSVPAW
jgi:SAM-dependent methyltransferase